ncbi:MAG: CDP-diacylglycerol--serine O-phosphatidyltransferase [bacterium]
MKKGVYVLPNLFTMGNMILGFFAIVTAMNEDFHKAAIAIIFAAVFDGLDGKVARLTHSTSRFGIEFDSLADVISFGVAPAILMYLWALKPYGRIGWLAACLFMSCGALRLARFNVQSAPFQQKYFTGLPIPAAAGMVATFIIFHEHLWGVSGNKPIVIALLTYVCAFLMVSNIKYHSLKELELKKKKPFNILVIAFLIIYVVIAIPQIILFVLACLYALSGPVEFMWGHSFKGRFAFLRDAQGDKQREKKV